MSPRPRPDLYPSIFLWCALGTTLFGLWRAFEPQVLAWWRIEAPPSTSIQRYERLRPFTRRAVEVDYLMDKTPEGAVSDPKRWNRIQQRQRDTGQRFRAEFALAPTQVRRLKSLAEVRRRAARRQTYYVIVDPDFHSDLRDVVKVLLPIAKKHGLVLETHKVKGSSLVVMKPEGEEPLPYWAESPRR